MLAISNKVREITGVDPRALPDDVLLSTQPLVLKGLVADWPMVRAGLNSNQSAIAYIRKFYRDATVGALLGAPDIEGRFFYNEDLSGFNFKPVKLKLDVMLDEVERHKDAVKLPAIYVGSTTVDTCLPGFRDENDLGFGDRQPLVSIWLGNRTRIAAHHDLPDNCLRGGRPSPLHFISTRAAGESLHRAAGFHARRPAHQHGGLRQARLIRWRT